MKPVTLVVLILCSCQTDVRDKAAVDPPTSHAETSEPAQPPSPTTSPPEEEPAGITPEIHYLRGVEQLDEGKPRRAISSFSQCLKLDAGYCKCERGLGDGYAKISDMGKSDRHYARYVMKCAGRHELVDDVRRVEKLLWSHRDAQRDDSESGESGFAKCWLNAVPPGVDTTPEQEMDSVIRGPAECGWAAYGFTPRPKADASLFASSG